ncbi:MAG: hypothetical protein ACPMAQ_16815 [Phycisphaerae bacterium]
MSRAVSIPMLCAPLPVLLLVMGGCPEPAAPVSEAAWWATQWKSAPEAGELEVDAGPDRVASVGELFWLDARACGGTLPYTFSWSVCPGAAVGKAPLILGGDRSLACITVYGTCRLRVTVTDASGRTAAAEVAVTVP